MSVRLARTLHIWRSVLRKTDLRRVVLAFVGFNVAEYGTWIAIMVFAYRVGGVTASGLVGAVQLLPAAIFAPLASVLGDRYRRDRVLCAGYLLQAAAMGLAGLALLTGPPLALVYVLAAMAATSVTVTRPVQGALLPALSGTVEELTAANVVVGWIEGLSLFAGPLLTGALLLTVQPGAIFLLMAGAVLISAGLTARLEVASGSPLGGETSHLREETLAGFRALAANPRPRAIVSFLGAHFVLVGAIDVLFVVLAFRLLHIGSSGVGFMNAAFGLGGLASAGLMAGMVSQRRLVPSLVAGATSWGIGLGCVALATSPLVAPFQIGLAGAGRPLVDIAGRTLLQRVVAGHMLSRVFGVLEGISMASQAIGMALVPVLFLVLGNRLSFVALGLFLPALLVLTWRSLSAADTARVPLQAIAVVRGVPFFAPLSELVVEHLASCLIPVEAPAGSTIIQLGDIGDRFYIIASGEVAVSREGHHLATFGAGGFFGEIALLRDVPRTATVTAATDVELYALEREDFLEALTGHVQSRRAAEVVADARLTENRAATARQT